jgi:hypothetical protein
MFALVPKMFDFFGLRELDRRDKVQILRLFYSSLELGVGWELASGLTERELADFEEIIHYLSSHDVAPEDDPSLAWLEHVRPDYREIVHKWIRRLLLEIFDRRARIAEIGEVALGRTSSDPVSETLEYMQLESRRIAARRSA